MRKLRPDAKWLQLPPAAQAELASELERKTLADTRVWLREKHGVVMSPTSLSRFLTWYHITRVITDSADTINQIKRELQAVPDAKLDDTHINAVCNRGFELLALRRQDAQLYLKLQGRRIQDLTAADAKKDAIIAELRAEIAVLKAGSPAAAPVDPAKVAADLDAALGRKKA